MAQINVNDSNETKNENDETENEQKSVNHKISS